MNQLGYIILESRVMKKLDEMSPGILVVDLGEFFLFLKKRLVYSRFFR